MFAKLASLLFGRRTAPKAEPELARERIRGFLARADSDLSFIPLSSEVINPVHLVRSGPSSGFTVPEAIWAIKTRKGDHFISATRTNDLNDKRWVLMVEARRFYAVWLASRNQATGMPNIPPDYDDLPKMDGWGEQQRWWGKGLTDPVPLAVISNSFIRDPHRHMIFENGRLRLAWLIYHGAAAFPIEITQKEEPTEFVEMMGVNGFSPITVDALTS